MPSDRYVALMTPLREQWVRDALGRGLLTQQMLGWITKRGRYHDARGLHLQVSPTGAKSWLLRYTLNKRERWMGLGPLHTYTLDEARERARKMRQLIGDGGVDPIEVRIAVREAWRAERAEAKRAAAVLTFEHWTRHYFRATESKLKNLRHRQHVWSAFDRYVLPAIGKLPTTEIDEEMVAKFLNSLPPSVVKLVHRHIKAIFDFGRVHRDDKNPADIRLPVVADRERH
jgi:Arm DNA-binding domain